MSARKVRVTVTRSVEYVAEIEIDGAEYTRWLDAEPETTDTLVEFLAAGSDVDEVIGRVVEHGDQDPKPDEWISEARWSK